MRDVLALRNRTLAFLEGTLRRPSMYTPGGMSVEAFLLDALTQLAYIDETESALEGELAKLRSSGLWLPTNHVYGVTAAFEAALTDRVGDLGVEVAAVYAEVAHCLGYVPQVVHVPSPDAWREANAVWSAGPLTARRAKELLGYPTCSLGSSSHDLALCYGLSGGGWAVLHFKTSPHPSGPRFHGVGDGSSLRLRWARLSLCNLDKSLVVAPAGYELSRRGRAHPEFRLDRWLAGDPDPFDRLPQAAGES